MLIALGLGLALATFAPSARAQTGAPAPAPEHAAGGATVRAGYLTCHVESGWGIIFGSSRKLKCAYAMQPGYTEYYTGSITKFGADIGYLQSGVILWAVLAPTTNLGQGSLEGHYGGATASAAVNTNANIGKRFKSLLIFGTARSPSMISNPFQIEVRKWPAPMTGSQ